MKANYRGKDIGRRRRATFFFLCRCTFLRSATICASEIYKYRYNFWCVWARITIYRTKVNRLILLFFPFASLILFFFFIYFTNDFRRRLYTYAAHLRMGVDVPHTYNNIDFFLPQIGPILNVPCEIRQKSRIKSYFAINLFNVLSDF